MVYEHHVPSINKSYCTCNIMMVIVIIIIMTTTVIMHLPYVKHYVGVALELHG